MRVTSPLLLGWTSPLTLASRSRTAAAHGPVDAVRPSGFTSGTVVKAKKEDAEAEEEEDATSVREKRSEAVTAEAE